MRAIVCLAVVVFIACAPIQSFPTPMPTPTAESSSSPPPSPIPNADAAIARVKSQFREVSQIQKTPAGMIGASQNIFVFERGDGWDIAFWQGDGDCPAGCINNRYYYFSVKRNGGVSKVGEYARIFDSQNNSFQRSGAPMWGVPRQ